MSLGSSHMIIKGGNVGEVVIPEADADLDIDLLQGQEDDIDPDAILED